MRIMAAAAWSLGLFCLLASPTLAAEPAKTKTLKALIVEGQNNHRVWPKTTKMMKSYLEETGLFKVDVATTKPSGVDEQFSPEFSKYDVVVSNYNGKPWPEKTQKAFEDFVQSGGGFVVVHAANNSFPEWSAYNEMIGLGGWNKRDERSGPYVYYDGNNKLVRDKSKGKGGHHGRQHDFVIVVRDASHPVTKGMPNSWLHVNDELYDMLRGPAKNMKVLATAYADKSKGGSGRHEPMIFSLSYGKGRVFHTPMGHGIDSQSCVGFIATLQRGAEWAATGRVTQAIPDDFPGTEKTSRRDKK